MQSNNIHQYSIPTTRKTAYSGVEQRAVSADANSVGPNIVPDNNNARTNISTNAITMRVLSVNSNNLLLQIEGSQERLSLPVSSLEIKGELNKGDIVMLTAIKNNTAKLVVIENAIPPVTQFKESGLSTPILRQLSTGWPDTSISELNKANIKPVVDIAVNTPRLQSTLIDWLIQNSEKSLLNQRVIVASSATVKQTNQDEIALQIKLANTQKTINALVPLPKESIFKTNGQADIALTATIKPVVGGARAVIDTLELDNARLPTNVLRRINESLTVSDNIAIERAFKQNFFNSEFPFKRQSSIVFRPDEKLLKTFSNSQETTLKANEADVQAVLIRQQNGKSSFPNLLLYEKPTTILTSAQNILRNDKNSPPSTLLQTIDQVGLSKKPQSNQLAARPSVLVNNAESRDTAFSSTGPETTDTKEIKPAQIRKQLAETLTQISDRTVDSDNGYSKALNLLAESIEKTSTKSYDVMQQVMGKNLINTLRLTALSGDTLSINSMAKHPSANNATASATLQHNLAKTPLRNDNPVESGNFSAVSSSFMDDLVNPESVKSVYSSDLVRQLLQDQLPGSQSSTLTSPATSMVSNKDSMVEGLINMLSLRLLSKLDVELKNSLANFPSLRNFVQNMSATTNASTIRNAAAELDKLDANNELIRALRSTTARQHSNALRTLESTLQQQDAFYFTLPNILNPQHKDIELRIRAIEDEDPSSAQNTYQKSWLIDMRLDIGEEGDVLAKVKLAGGAIKLNLYASEIALMKKTNKLLPKLTNRLTALGLQVTEQYCYFSKNTEPPSNQQNQTDSTYRGVNNARGMS